MGYLESSSKPVEGRHSPQLVAEYNNDFEDRMTFQEGEASETEIVLPVKQRRVKDIIFLLAFIAFIVSLVALIVCVCVHGDIGRLTHGVDRHGNVCGQRNQKIADVEASGQDLTDQPYAEAGALEAGVVFYNCTSQCASQSTSIFYRCVPKRIANLASSFGEIAARISSGDFLEESVKDIEKCWREIIYLCLIALAISIVLVVLLRFLAFIIVWLSIVLAVVVSIAGTSYLWYLWVTAKKELASKSQEFQKNFQSSVDRWLYYAIIATIATVILLLILLVMRNRIRLVIALFKETGKVVTAMPLLLLQPIWTFLFLIAICGSWVYALLWIESSGIATVYDKDFVVYKKNPTMQFTRWYHLFGLFWLTQFCMACQEFVIGSAVTQWYFTRDKSQLKSPIFTGIGRFLRYHLGSVAFGSLIIAILKFIRVIFNYIEKKFLAHGETSVCRALSCCINCCLKCFENFIKYLSRNAYIEIAIFGSSFCEGARRAFEIIGNNALRVAAINSVGDFVLFLSKLAVMITVIVCGIEMIKIKPEVQHVWVPIALCALFALLISHCFLTVYEMSIDTILVCFCEDCDLNDGSESRPYFMSSTLMEFVNNSRKQLAMVSKDKNKVQPAPPSDGSAQHI